MANNVYIGSRYVPIFDGDWVNNKTYEALTIVTYGNNSYTSKIPVPLNTPPTGQSTDPYWALTGNYNGQIADLQTQIDNAVDAIDDLSANLDLLKYGDIIIMSDSYGYSPSIPEAWTGKLRALLPNTCYIINGGGQGFGTTPSLTNTLINNASSIAHPEKVGLIIVGCGYNDRVPVSSVPSGMQAFCTYAAQQYPNAKVLIAFIPLSTTGSYTQAFRTQVLPVYKKTAAQISNCAFIHGSEFLFINYKNMQSDGIHPNPDGGSDIAWGIHNYLVSGTAGYCGIDHQIDQTLTSSGPHSTAYTDKVFRCMVQDGMMEILINGTIGLSYSNAQAPLAWIEIGTITGDGFMNGCVKEYSSCIIPCQIYTINNEYVTGACWLGVQDKKVYAKPAGTVNFTKLQIPSGVYKIPTLMC